MECTLHFKNVNYTKLGPFEPWKLRMDLNGTAMQSANPIKLYSLLIWNDLPTHITVLGVRGKTVGVQFTFLVEKANKFSDPKYRA